MPPSATEAPTSAPCMKRMSHLRPGSDSKTHFDFFATVNGGQMESVTWFSLNIWVNNEKICRVFEM